MKLKIILTNTAALFLMLCLTSCSETELKSETTDVIPPETTATTVTETITETVIGTSTMAPLDEKTQEIPTVDWEKAAKIPADLIAAPESDFAYSYDADLDGIVITKYKGDATSVIIPAAFEDEPVVKIEDKAFQGNNKVQYVYFPNNIISIHGGAFTGCSNLTLVIPDNVEFLDVNIDPSIKNLALSDNMIGKNSNNYLPFFQALSKENNTVENIKYKDITYDLTGEKRIETVAELYALITGGNFNIDAEIAKDWHYSYVDYTDKGYDIKGLTIIGHNNLSEKLKVTVPSEIEGKPVVSIGYQYDAIDDENILKLITVFDSTANIIEITIPETVKIIGDGAFHSMSNLQTVNLPNSIICIGKGAFSNNTALKNITLPVNLEVIKSHAFKKCNSFVTLTIPKSVTYIEEKTFDNCENLTTATYKDKIYLYDREIQDMSGEFYEAINNT